MFDLNIDQGCDYSITLKLRDPAKVLINLTGFTFVGEAKLKYAQVAPDFAFAFTILDQITNTGELKVSVARASTALLPLTECTPYRYDIEMTDTSNMITRILSGNAFVSPEVTK